MIMRPHVDIKVFATYWPQWHATAINDYWFEENYTDWQLLCNNALEHCATNKVHADLLHPLSRDKGGLGWYDLNDRTVRKRQAHLAREHGVYGFAIYHFWFARPAEWGRGASWRGGAAYGADMDATVMKLLDDRDGEPNLPFYFTWANEAFVFRWTNWTTGRVAQLKKGDMQVPQTYPEASWRQHWEYLLPFFRHRNYHRIDGKPVFAIYTNGGNGAGRPPDLMFAQLRKWALEDGLPGLYLMQYAHDRPLHRDGGASRPANPLKEAPSTWADGMQEFGWSSGFGEHRTAIDRPQWLPADRGWNHGMIIDFDNTCRMGTSATVATPRGHEGLSLGGPASLARGLHLLLNATEDEAREAGASAASTREAMVLLVAWNEWSEQATLEPSDLHGFANLEAVRRVLREHKQDHYVARAAEQHAAARARERAPTFALPELTACAQYKWRPTEAGEEDCAERLRRRAERVAAIAREGVEGSGGVRGGGGNSGKISSKGLSAAHPGVRSRASARNTTAPSAFEALRLLLRRLIPEGVG